MVIKVRKKVIKIRKIWIIIRWWIFRIRNLKVIMVRKIIKKTIKIIKIIIKTIKIIIKIIIKNKKIIKNIVKTIINITLKWLINGNLIGYK